MPRHVDPEDLALLALGEFPDGVEASHVAACEQCSSELDELRVVVSTARAVRPEDTPVAPPSRVWEAVATELGIDSGTGSATITALTRPADRRRTWAIAAAAAVAGIALGAGATAVLTGSDDGSADRGRLVASTRLVPLPDHTGSGAAEVLGTGSSRVLQLDVTGLTPGNGFYEVWLLDADAQRLVSLGLLEGSTGRFPLPPQVDVTRFPVVDVSLEPADGNPAHSGDSVVRGTLTG